MTNHHMKQKKHISQSEARRLRTRVNKLEAKLNNMATDWPSGVQILRIELSEKTREAIRVAHSLNHTLVIHPTDNGNGVARIVAIPNINLARFQ